MCDKGATSFTMSHVDPVLHTHRSGLQYYFEFVTVRIALRKAIRLRASPVTVFTRENGQFSLNVFDFERPRYPSPDVHRQTMSTGRTE